MPSQVTYPAVPVFQHGAPLQQSCVGEQDAPTSEQVGGGVQTQPFALVHGTPFSRQVVLSPVQHACVGEQAAPDAEQVAAGISQVQPTSEAPQACCAVPPAGITVQESPEQQLAAVAAVHCRPASTQVLALSQKPPVQERPPQHGELALHAWPASPQRLTSGWQVPEVVPLGTWQAKPAQQSAETVHEADCAWHSRTHWRVSRSQSCEQHSAPSAQTAPVPLHVGAAHLWSAPQVPEQQSSAAVQAPPVETHATPPQRRMPASSGTHGEPSQHCSRNWQTVPVALQQSGLLASQPVGQDAVWPPKHRMMPFVSGLQTAALPSQQFCDAFTVPWPPQMLPGGLQLVPLVQVRSFFELVSNSGGTSFFPVPPGPVPGPSQ